MVQHSCFHADLWRQAAILLQDNGSEKLAFPKNKAHRSHLQATGSADEPAWCWVGNKVADDPARELCDQVAETDGHWAARGEERSESLG